MTTTRRQHYVWKHYLMAWVTGSSLCVLRKDGKAFATNPVNVAQSRDFYRLPVLTEDDERFVEAWIESATSPELIKQLNREAFETLARPSRVRRAVGRDLIANAALEAALVEAEIQAEERYFASREAASVDALAQLRSGHASFWSDENEAMNFAVFISQQLMRTKRMQETYLERFPAALRGTAERTWFLLRTCSVNGLGFSVFADRKEFAFDFLEAPKGTSFITGDQPIRNLVDPSDRNNLALFYPVSPSTAVIFRHSKAPPPPTACCGRETS